MPLFFECGHDVLRDHRNGRVEAVLQAGEARLLASRKDVRPASRVSCGARSCPIRRGLEQVKDVVLVVEEQALLDRLFDLQIAAHGQIDDGGCDVARMDGVVDAALRFGGRDMPLGGSYMGATDMPGSGSRPLYHHSANITPKVTEGQEHDGIAAQEPAEVGERTGLLQNAFGNVDVDGHAAAHGQRICGFEMRRRAPLTLRRRWPSVRAVDAGEGLRAQTSRRRAGELHVAEAWSMGTGQSLPVTFQ